MENLFLASVNWGKVGMVLGIIAAIAIVFAILILVITKICKIQEDEKVAKILENLAGANCGGCGHSGCEGFAKAVAEGKANLTGCQVTSEEAKQVIAKIAGINYSSKEKTVAVVRCSGGVFANNKFEYSGNEGCPNIKVLRGGYKQCEFGCLGGGTCTTKCPTKAIKMTENKTPFVDRSLCISCGACMLACPKYTVTRIPVSAKVYVACNSKCKGKDVINACKNGCIACGMCARTCQEGAITMVNNIPVFDYSKCVGCYKCVEKCPRNVIKRTDGVIMEKPAKIAPSPKMAQTANLKPIEKVDAKPVNNNSVENTENK